MNGRRVRIYLAPPTRHDILTLARISYHALAHSNSKGAAAHSSSVAYSSPQKHSFLTTALQPQPSAAVYLVISALLTTTFTEPASGQWFSCTACCQHSTSGAV